MLTEFIPVDTDISVCKTIYIVEDTFSLKRRTSDTDYANSSVDRLRLRNENLKLLSGMNFVARRIVKMFANVLQILRSDKSSEVSCSS
jgi:hypothetical protein